MRERYRNGDPIGLNNCDGCNPSNINGVLCHETGCPHAWKDYPRECMECGGECYGNFANIVCDDCIEELSE